VEHVDIHAGLSCCAAPAWSKTHDSDLCVRALDIVVVVQLQRTTGIALIENQKLKVKIFSIQNRSSYAARVLDLVVIAIAQHRVVGGTRPRFLAFFVCKVLDRDFHQVLGETPSGFGVAKTRHNCQVIAVLSGRHANRHNELAELNRCVQFQQCDVVVLRYPVVAFMLDPLCDAKCARCEMALRATDHAELDKFHVTKAVSFEAVSGCGWFILAFTDVWV
jgi:hypothetical protein